MNRTLIAIIVSLLAAAPVSAAVSISWTPAPDAQGNTPAGYISYDLMVTTDANVQYDGLGVMELRIDTGNPADIYQNVLGQDTGPPNPAFFDAFPPLEFDSYVTMPVGYGVVGAAVDVGGPSPRPIVFNDQTADIAWGATGGAFSGPGTFQMARITLADTASGSWSLKAWELDSNAASFAGRIRPEPTLYGDVNGDGFVGGLDFTTIITNWGSTGDGDLDGDGNVGGADYTEVITYWGTSLAPGDMGSLPPMPPDIPFGWPEFSLMTAIITNWGEYHSGWEWGDVSGDGFVGGDDLNMLLTAWGSGGFPPEPPSGIPEPATLSFLLIASLPLLKKRR